jgi:hypothetical protein
MLGEVGDILFYRRGHYTLKAILLTCTSCISVGEDQKTALGSIHIVLCALLRIIYSGVSFSIKLAGLEKVQ